MRVDLKRRAGPDKLRLGRAGGALLLAALSSCSDDSRPPNNLGTASGGSSAGGGTSKGGSGKGGSTNAAGAAGEPQAGAGSSAGGSGSAGEAGDTDAGGDVGSGGSPEGGGGGNGGTATRPCPSDSASDVPPALDSLCDESATWGAATKILLLEYATQLVAVTPDELTLVFYAETSGPSTFLVSDRASPEAPFDPARELPSLDIQAVSPDGLRLIALSPDRKAFSELTRSVRGDAFEVTTESAFATLNADAQTNDLTFSAAVVSADDQTLYYLASGSEPSDFPLHVSTRRGTGDWPVGTPLEACELQAQGALLRRPTGISADGLTLFFFDEVRRSSRAAWREAVTGPFVWFADLGAINHAQPNATCNRLYFTAPRGPSFSIAE